MHPTQLQQADIADLLGDVSYLNQAANDEAVHLAQQLRQCVESSWTPDPVGETALSEIGGALGALSARVKLVENSLQCLQLQLDHQSRPTNRRVQPPGMVILSCDELGDVAGLLDKETSAEGIDYRWSGDNPVIELALKVARAHSTELQIALFALIRPAYGQQMKIRVDGQEFSHRFARDGALFLATVNLPPSSAALTRIVIELPATHSPAELGQSTDLRRLGVALSEIRFLPRAGLLMRLLKRLHRGR
jgi:hypothetical protein